MHLPCRNQPTPCPRWQFTLAIAAICGALTSGALAQQATGEDPGPLYLDGYLMVEDAAKLEQQGKFAEALRKYNDAKNVFDTIARNHPGWRPEVVNFRRGKVNEAVARCRPRVPGTGANTVGVKNYPSPDRIPTHLPPASVARGGTASQQLLNEKETQIRRLRAISEEHLRKRQQAQEMYHATLQELKRSQLAQSTLIEDLKRTQAQLAAADNDPEAIKRLQADVKRLNNELAIANEALEAADKRNETLEAELGRANDVIASLTTERDELQKERERTLELLKGSDDDDVKALLAENQKLKTELAAAKKEVKRLAGEKERDTAQIAALRQRLGEVEGRLAELQRENSAYEERIAALSSKLRRTEANLQEAMGPDGGAALAKSALEENEALRAIVTRQIKQQAWRKQAKELVIAQILEQGADSREVIQMIEELANQGSVISKQEQELLKDSLLGSLGSDEGWIIEPGGNGDVPYPELGTHNDGDLTPIGLNQTLTEYARAVASDFYRERFDRCEQGYSDILKIAPDNLYALRNLGIVKMRLGKPDEAEELFKRALSVDASDGYSHFILGVLYYRRGQDDLAFSAMDRGLTFDPENAKAHHYLGAMCIKRGLRERARQEFQSVIAIDPTFGDAYYNLAYLCVTDSPPQLERARDFYHKAQKNGTDADSAMDRALGT